MKCIIDVVNIFVVKENTLINRFFVQVQVSAQIFAKCMTPMIKYINFFAEIEVFVLKKIPVLILCFAFLLLCACQSQSEQNKELLPSNASTEYVQSVKEESSESVLSTEAVPEWKTAYLNFLENEKDYNLSYALVYIDDDNIPELYSSGVCEADGDSVCSYKNGNIVEQSLIRIGGGRYIEKGGVLINQNGNMGSCHTNVYKLTDQGFTQTFSAFSIERVKHIENDKYDISYTYSVEDKPVSEDDYNAAVNGAFDFAQSVWLDENSVTYDEIKQQIVDCK